MIKDTMLMRMTSKYSYPAYNKNLTYFEPSSCIVRSVWDIWLDKQKSSDDERIAKGALSIQRKLAGKKLKFSLS